MCSKQRKPADDPAAQAEPEPEDDDGDNDDDDKKHDTQPEVPEAPETPVCSHI